MCYFYSLTVAMMSRITLHLRKQARGRKTETDSWERAGSHSRLRFTHSGGRSGTIAGTHLPSMSVTVEETSVMHDDRGNILGNRESEFPPRPPCVRPENVEEEWYEMASLTPPQPARLAV